jgi:hypothetical protein
VKERRSARIGTVSGLSLLAGGTAVAAVAGGAHSIFATILLGLLALGMGHALLDEIRRQTERRIPRWVRQDWVNAVLLGCWAEASLLATILVADPVPVRGVLAVLTAGYAGACLYFVTLRRRTIASLAVSPGAASTAASGAASAARGRDEAAPVTLPPG